MIVEPKGPRFGTREWRDELSDGIKGAWIIGGLGIVAAIVYGVFQLASALVNGGGDIEIAMQSSQAGLETDEAEFLTLTAAYRTLTPTFTTSPTPTPTASSPPSSTNTPTNTATATASSRPGTGEETPSIRISEIMIAPFVPASDRGTNKASRNEYVELYNFGEVPVDVANWWISDSGAGGEPDRIVAWDDRFSDIPVSSSDGVVTNSTVMPPGSYALILAPDYRYGNMPYTEQIGAGAIILTLADTGAQIQVIGKDGLSGTQEQLDTLVLYIGTVDSIDLPVSTYGTPEHGVNPLTIKDNEKDDIPYDLEGNYAGVLRLDLEAGDYSGNWERMTLSEASPGYGE